MKDNNKPFWIVHNIDMYKKGDIINKANGQKWKVIKVYKFNWFFKFIRFIGIRILSQNGIKVKQLN